eukprot:TRINITY_DN1684_c0_g1_i14.p2 TRINITY_DN1684_c0_g1~~TRINITY_DN1684_c0_g1_i14.p2  ORF type:complete len:144 (+),score=5.50 TRINITY_DN1684_c0_g1_i14:106-537(+)
MIRRPPRSTLSSSSAASDVYKRQPTQIFLIQPCWLPRRAILLYIRAHPCFSCAVGYKHEQVVSLLSPTPPLRLKDQHPYQHRHQPQYSPCQRHPHISLRGFGLLGDGAAQVSTQVDGVERPQPREQQEASDEPAFCQLLVFGG